MKRIRNIVLQTIAITCIVSSMTISAFASTYKVLGVNRYVQEKSKWCWAACAQMIGEYKQEQSILNQPYANTQNLLLSIQQQIYMRWKMHSGIQREKILPASHHI